MSEKKFGKIKSVSFGFGGYQDAMFGLSFDLGGDGWGVGDFWGNWAEHSDHCKWTKQDRRENWGDLVERIKDLCKKAKVDSVEKLRGIPVEIEFERMTLKSWRILNEVL